MTQADPDPTVPPLSLADSTLIGGGEMGKLVRAKGWSRTPLGPIDSWPTNLRTAVSLVLNSHFPISLAWGPQHIQIYNDGYWPICGDKHPTAMGRDFTECWASAFPVIGDVFRSALSHRSSVAGGGEVGELAANFNAMAAELVRNSSRLRESEQRFRLAASTGNVWDWNIESNCTAFPRELWLRLDYEDQDIANPAEMFESILHPEDRARWRQAIKDHINRRLPYDLDYRVRAKAGEYRWVNTKGQAQWNEHGRATYMAGTGFEISERKLAEQIGQEQLDKLLRWQALMIGREERVLQLKAEVNELLARHGEPARYPGQVDS